jgi:hypothetical protein
MFFQNDLFISDSWNKIFFLSFDLNILMMIQVLLYFKFLFKIIEFKIFSWNFLVQFFLSRQILNVVISKLVVSFILKAWIFGNFNSNFLVLRVFLIILMMKVISALLNFYSFWWIFCSILYFPVIMMLYIHW